MSGPHTFHVLPPLVLLCTLLTPLRAGQRPERHFGCPPGKNVCIYPIDAAAMQCETRFDFQVELNLPLSTPLTTDVRSELDITVVLPSGDAQTPEQLFGKQPLRRTWALEAFEDAADETPDGFIAYGLVYRNVVIPRAAGKGAMRVVVRARGVVTEVGYHVREATRRRARNVVLFVGDGMALPMMAAARLVSRGMTHGKYKDMLFMEKMEHMGLQSPAGVDSIITDSANSATSMNTGHKSSVNALGVYADSGDDDFGHPKQETIAEYVKRQFNMSVGVVTTAEVQDATPAAVWAHTRRRARKAAITKQALLGCDHCEVAVQPEVLMGGGGKYFLPADSYDGANWYVNFSAAGYTVTHTRDEMLAAAKDAGTTKLLTVAHRGNMEVWLDRNVYKENMDEAGNAPKGDGAAPTDQPNLDEMVMAGLEVLSRHENGFYLMVEAASIDKSAHPLDIPRTLSDLLELDKTVAMVHAWAVAQGDETLIIATADHGHGFDVFGTVDTQLWDEAVTGTGQMPVSDVEHMCAAVTDVKGRVFNVTTEGRTGMRVRQANLARRGAVGTYADAGYPDYADANADGFPDTWNVRTTLAAGMNNYPDHTEDYKVSASLREPAEKTRMGAVNNPADDPNGIFLTGQLPPQGSTGVHTMQDVGVFASGPGAHRVKGIMDNTEIFHVIASALGFGTDGKLDEEGHAEGDFVRCRHAAGRCHCGLKGKAYACACEEGGVQSFVKGPGQMCEMQNGELKPMSG